MVGTYGLSSGITALIKQLSHWRPGGEGIMGKQYPRLEISLLCKSAASLAPCCIKMWPELEVSFQDASLGFQDMNRQDLSRAPLQKVPSAKNTNTA